MLRRLSRAIPTRPWTSLPSSASRQFIHSTKLTALPRALEHFTSGQAFCTSATGSRTDEPSAHARKLLAHIDLMEELTCSGCGIEMQFKDEAKVGYCSTAALEKIEDVQEIATKLICQRCFQIRNYGKITDTKMAYDEYEKRVKALKPRDMLMIQLVDILDITGSLLGNARHVVGKKPVLLVVNKADMIPTHSGARRLMRRIKMAAEDLGIENVIGIRLVSSTKSLGIKEIIGDIKRHRENRDVCVIGAANAGKSTFLNALISHVSKSKKFGGKATQHRELEDISLDDFHFEDKAPEQLVFNEDEIDADEEVLSLKHKKQLSKGAPSKHMTTSALPGTTLAVSPIPVVIGQKPCNVLDTPGLIVDKKRQRLVEILSQPGCMELTNAIPGKKLPTTIYKVAPGRSLFLGAMLRMDYENTLSTKGKNELLFTWYGVLPGHLSKTEHADDTFMKHAGGLLSPPRGLDAISLTGPLLPHNSGVKLSDFITTDVKTKSKLAKRPKRTTLVELVVPGFGWLAVTGVDLDGTLALEQTLKKASIKFSTVDGIQVHPRVPLFPYEMSSSNKHEWKQ